MGHQPYLIATNASTARITRRRVASFAAFLLASCSSISLAQAQTIESGKTQQLAQAQAQLSEAQQRVLAAQEELARAQAELNQAQGAAPA